MSKKACLANQQQNDLGNGWLKQHAGSGAFTLHGWKASESVLLERNPHYASQTGNPKTYCRPGSAGADAQTRRCRCSLRPHYGTAQTADSGCQRNAGQATVVGDYAALLQYHSPQLAKPQVWQAIKWALDYDSIQKNILALTYTVHQSFLPGGFPAVLDDTPFHKDVSKAKALLAEAGYPQGFEITLDHYSMQPYPDIAQAVQTQLAAIGIKVSLIAFENRQVLTKMRAHQHQLAMTSWGVDYFDPNSNTEAFCVNTDNSTTARNRTLAWAVADLTNNLIN